jgi:hypothetical protein
VQLPNVEVPSTHAVLPAGGAATELLPLLHAPSSANATLSSSRLNFVRRRIVCFSSLVLPVYQFVARNVLQKIRHALLSSETARALIKYEPDTLDLLQYRA